MAGLASVGTAGTTGDITAGTSVNVTTTAAIGDLVVVIVTKDNVGTTDSTTAGVFTTATDTAGNVWTKQAEARHSSGIAGDGTEIGIFTSVLTATMTAATITVNFAASTTASAVTVWRFTCDSGSVVSVPATPQLEENAAGGDTGALTISSLTSLEYLFIRAVASEKQIQSIATATASYTKFTGAVADTGSNPSSMNAMGEWRILTGTGDTSDPALTSTNPTNASLYLALRVAVVSLSNISIIDTSVAA